ncbi:MAG: ParA family protein [Spirochaetia bacterium]|nr:ParA family protein [Spirochaetia bacterium]
MSAKKIIFLNQKGGVGKTTSVVNLGAALAILGKKVLLIDFDSQGNLSSSLSVDNGANGAYEVITKQISALEACQKTNINNLEVISANIDLAGLNIELVNLENRNFFVKEALSSLDDKFDYIIGDCPPSLGLVSVNSLVWANYVIIPMQCEYLAMEGLNSLMRTVATIKRTLNTSLEILGILFTMYNKRTKLSIEVVEDVSQYFDSLVFKTLIPRNIRLSEAPSHGLPIFSYDNSCSGAKAYYKFAQEVISRVE